MLVKFCNFSLHCHAQTALIEQIGMSSFPLRKKKKVDVKVMGAGLVIHSHECHALFMCHTAHRHVSMLNEHYNDSCLLLSSEVLVGFYR